jgi:hypothetical protein
MNIDSIISNFFHDKSSIYVKDLLFNLKQNNKNSKMNESNMINCVINSSEFNEYFSKVFEETYCLYFEKDESSMSVIRKRFFQDVVKNNKQFNIGELKEYVKDSVEFKEYYQKLIRHLASFLCNKSIIDEKYIVDILEKFKQINLEDYLSDEHDQSSLQNVNEILTRMIMDRLDNCETNDKELKKINQIDREYFIIRHQKQFGKNPSLNNDIVRFEEFIKNKTNLIDIYFNIVYNEINDEYFGKMVKYFLNIFGREMTVYEYKNIYTLSKHENYEKIIMNYKEKFDIKYKICANLHNLYTNKPLDIHYFCKVFFEYIDENNDDYTKNVINILIDTEIYKTTMIKTISDIYLNQFDKTILESDINYYYNNVYQEKLNLQDEKLLKLITQLNNETNTYIENIHKLYEEILNRKADDTEIVDGLKIYRSNVKLDPSFHIKDILYESIEYHDVLKTWIIETFNLSKNSVIYTILRFILENKDNKIKRDKTLLKELVSNEFNL